MHEQKRLACRRAETSDAAADQHRTKSTEHFPRTAKFARDRCRPRADNDPIQHPGSYGCDADHRPANRPGLDAEPNAGFEPRNLTRGCPGPAGDSRPIGRGDLPTGAAI